MAVHHCVHVHVYVIIIFRFVVCTIPLYVIDKGIKIYLLNPPLVVRAKQIW